MGGLGQLVDGQKGMDNFRSDVYGFGKGKSDVVTFVVIIKPGEIDEVEFSLLSHVNIRLDASRIYSESN